MPLTRSQVFLVCMLIYLIKLSVVKSMENGVIGEPRVDCGVESINVWIRTESPFKGRLYAEEESEHPECVHTYSGPTADHLDSRGAEFNIRFGQCNMRRQRVLNPRGVSYSFTLVISFHPVFLTGVDRAFNIKCFFLEAVKAVDTSLDVSALSTHVVEQEFTLPQCNYHLKQSPDGPFLKFANIGEPITHVWSCDGSAGVLYGVLIHSCYVDDGRGNRFDLMDDRGCPTDKYLLNEVVYDEQHLGAFANTHVFRYSDRIQLFFTCTLQLCFKEDGGCQGITPPTCSEAKSGSIDLSIGAIPPQILTHHQRIPPPGVSAERNLLRKLNRRPSGSSTTANSASIPQFLNHQFPFTNPFKDSPLNGTDDIEEIVNTSTRASREANNGMETDLSVDLTVLPLHQSISPTFESVCFRAIQARPSGT
uniref:ZP domain-containing protein n=1 Tax=Ditylenchus dipsaci TaxID=166011 RepID=A0A915ELJ4_9BILA